MSKAKIIRIGDFEVRFAREFTGGWSWDTYRSGVWLGQGWSAGTMRDAQESARDQVAEIEERKGEK